MRRREECGGGGIGKIQISLSNCGRSKRVGFWKNGCITLIHYRNKVAFYYNENTQELEVRHFSNSKNTIYYGKPAKYVLDNFSILVFYTILANLINSPNVKFNIKELKGLVNKIILFITQNNEDLPHWANIIPFFNKILYLSDNNLSIFAYGQHMKNKSRLVKVRPSLDTINENNENS